MKYEQEQVETVCSECVFVDREGNEQVGCQMRVLERYRAQGARIKKITDMNNRKYNTLPGRVCVYCRPKKWATDNQLLNFDQCAVAVRKEVTFKCDAVVVVGEDASLADAQRTVESLKKGSVKPNRVIFLTYPHIKPSEFFHWAHTLGVPWQFEIIMGKKSSHLGYVELATKKSKTTYFSLFYAGYEPPENFLYCIDSFLNDQLQRFLALKGLENGNGYVLQRNAIKLVHGGIDELDYIERLEKLAEEQECQYLIKPVEEVIPSMRS